jgi:hypothetical protein
MFIWLRKKLTSVVLVSGLVLCVSPACQRRARDEGQVSAAFSVEVQTDKLRVKPDDRVAVRAAVRSAGSIRDLRVSGSLLVPTKGVEEIVLEPAGTPGQGASVFQGEIVIDQASPEGLYGITVEVEKGLEKACGKASFISGKVVGDFLIVSAFPEQNQAEEIKSYIEDFRSVGGNTVVIHSLISQKAWYPSRVCARAAAPGTAEDKVGAALKLAEESGLAALLSVSWDMTAPMTSAEYMKSTKAIIKELWEMYAPNAAFLGFYSYQEGSGTYLASQMREFSGAVKSHCRGLLTACAPYIDDPLLAGYLAAVDDLDIVIYQGAVMASYRKDNRKCFPWRRTKDFTGLSAGATMQRGKITLSHVELFGYLEKQYAGAYLASPDDIRAQILSAATAYGPDGITFFTYHHCIHELGKTIPEAGESRQAVREAMKSYHLIANSAAASSSHIGLYIPYSDWWLDRWTNAVLPALDAFRRLGLSPDVFPFIPPRGEEILPYYPYHLNEEQLEFLLETNSVLILADIAGMQDTDSLLLKRFVEEGGAAVLLGPRIPYGDSFEREELCGAKENQAQSHSWIEVKEALSDRLDKATRLHFPSVSISSWSPGQGRAIAVFEDGSGAVLANMIGKGVVFTVPLSLDQAAEVMPDLLRDVLDAALRHRGVGLPFDILGDQVDMDVAASLEGNTHRLAIVNYQATPVELRLRPLGLEPATRYELRNLQTGDKLGEAYGKDFLPIKMTVPQIGFICLSLTPLD